MINSKSNKVTSLEPVTLRQPLENALGGLLKGTFLSYFQVLGNFSTLGQVVVPVKIQMPLGQEYFSLILGVVSGLY